jgi:hypothetical protein
VPRSDAWQTTSACLFVIECPGDPEGTAVLVVLRNHARHICHAQSRVGFRNGQSIQVIRGAGEIQVKHFVYLTMTFAVIFG